MSNENKQDKPIKDFINLWQKQFEHITHDENMVSNMLKIFNQANFPNDSTQNEHTDLLKSINDELQQLSSSVKQLDERLAFVESQITKPSK